MATAGRTLRVALVANTKNFRAGMMSAVRDAKGFQGKMSAVAMNMRGVLGPALAGAAAAVGALAIKMGVDGVKAAMEEQRALAQLTTALNNVGQGFAETNVNQFIDDLMFATGVADDQLRPAFVKLVTATKDAAQAQDLLSLALDISAGTGRDLEGVSLALAKAATGQTTALRRLGVPLSAAAVKSGDLQTITAELSRTFQGQAAAAANTMAGRLEILQRGAEELQESFGTGVINALADTGDSAGDLAQNLRDLQGDAESLGESVGDSIGLLLDLVNGYNSAKDSVNGFIGSLGDLGQSIQNSVPILGQIRQIRAWSAILSGNDQALAEAYGVVGESANEAAEGGLTAFRVTAAGVNEEVEDLVEELGYLQDYINDTNAILNYEESWDALRKSLKENGKQFDYNTEAGRSNNQALIGFAESTAEVAASQETLFGKVAYVQDALGNLGKTFEKTKMSPATRAAMLEPFQALIDDLSDAGYDVSTLQLQIDKLQGKTIPITVTTTYIGTPPPGGYPREEANGGIVRGAGTSTSDSIPARLSNGEFVVRAASVRKFGAGLFQSLNAGVNPLADMSSANGGRAGGFSIGTINVNGVAGEGAETSLPRALRRMAFLAGMNG